MLTLPERRIGAPVIFKPLPPHPTPRELLLDALPMLDPPSRVTVTDAAERNVRLAVQGNWQSYDRQVTPYMVEPQDMTTSRRFSVVGFTGPAQSGKTQMLQNTALHRVTCDPMPVLIVHMTRPDRDKWVEEKLNPTIQMSPEIRDLLGRGRDDDTFSRKRFRGMRIAIGYPTPTTLSGDTRGLVALTDFDHFPEALGPKDRPEGSPLGMARQRIKTFMSRGCVLVESSCAFPWKDPAWQRPENAPHMMPPTKGGIIAVYNEGTRGRWYWECRDCGKEFEPRFDRLVYDDSLAPGAAGEGAEMACPHCGCLIGHRHKTELNRAALAGRGGWRHETAEGAICGVDDTEIRRTDIVSYALNGAAATFSSWSDLVAHYEAARRRADELQDTTDLAQVHYTEIGVPFRSTLGGDDDIALQDLKDGGQDTPRGVAPVWTRFITVSADVQKTRFVVQFTAWGEGGRAQVIDRFDLITPPDGAPDTSDAGDDRRALSPARYAEDWLVLEPLSDRVFEVQGEDHGFRALGGVVDFQGEPGVSDNAEAFWRSQRRGAARGFWFVSRGHGGLKQPRRIWYEAPDRGSKGRQARSIRILNIATDRVKDTIWSAIARGAEGTGGFFPAAWQPEPELAEFLAEQRTDKGWQKRPGQVRNESFDLSVMARALAEHKGMTRIDWSDPPTWAVGGRENSNAVDLASPSASPTTQEPKSAPAMPSRIKYLDRS